MATLKGGNVGVMVSVSVAVGELVGVNFGVGDRVIVGVLVGSGVLVGNGVYVGSGVYVGYKVYVGCWLEIVGVCEVHEVTTIKIKNIPKTFLYMCPPNLLRKYRESPNSISVSLFYYPLCLSTFRNGCKIFQKLTISHGFSRSRDRAAVPASPDQHARLSRIRRLCKRSPARGLRLPASAESARRLLLHEGITPTW